MPGLPPGGRSRRVRINFADSRPLATWIRWAILAAGVLTLATQTHAYTQLKQRLSAVESRAARASVQPTAGAATAGDPKALEARFVALERVVNRLTLDWQILFGELERIPNKDVALSSIEPEPDTRTLLLGGVAKDYPALLSYVATLRGSSVLGNVYLKKHEIARNQPQQGVAFTLSASWRELEQQANAGRTTAN